MMTISTAIERVRSERTLLDSPYTCRFIMANLCEGCAHLHDHSGKEAWWRDLCEVCAYRILSFVRLLHTEPVTDVGVVLN